MKIGIIGSRSRASNKDRHLIFDIVFEYVKMIDFEFLEIISGGCAQGADNFAEEAAKYFGVSMTIHYPQKLPQPKSYAESVERYYARNRKIAGQSDVLFALVASGRDGGTEYTLAQAKARNIDTYVLLLDGTRIKES